MQDLGITGKACHIPHSSYSTQLNADAEETRMTIVEAAKQAAPKINVMTGTRQETSTKQRILSNYCNFVQVGAISQTLAMK